MTVSKRVFEDIVQVIKTGIASGRLKPNQKLGSERTLSKKFKVGRGSIREAVKTLEAMALIALKKGRGGGILVAESARQHAQKALSSYRKLEESNILESLEFRKMIEPKMAFYAAIRRREEHLRIILKSIKEMEGDPNSIDNYARTNLTFHLTIAEASRNVFVHSFYQNTIGMLEDTAKLARGAPDQLDLTVYIHTQIYKAIRAKNPQKAEMLMNVHLSQIENDIKIAKELGLR